MTAIGAFLVVLATNMDRSIQEGTNRIRLLFQSMESIDLMSLLLFFVWYRLLKRARRLYSEVCKNRREKLFCQIPAALFSAFMLLGYSFYIDNSWNLVFGNTLQLIKSGIAFAGYFLLFQACIILLFSWLDRTDPGEGTRLPGILQIYAGWLEKYPFRTVFLTLLIAYLPYIIYSYPGIFSTDTKIQLQNADAAFAAGAGRLKNHHPVPHTLLLWFSAWFGEQVLSSVNAGIFLVALGQALLLFAAVAWCARFLLEKGVSPRYVCVMLGFYVISPRLRNYVFLLVKDVWFTAFLLFFLVEFLRELDGRFASAREKRLHLGILSVSTLGILFFRQDGVYVLLLSWLAALIACRRKRKLAAGVMAGVLAISGLYSQVLLPACQVSPTNPREMFSIPFQQTARYIRDAGDEVTEEEREAIGGILDYDSLAERYNPNLSDPVKATFDKDAPTEAVAAYFQTWFQMLWKHPEIYVQATMNNVYGYFYPAGYTTRLYSYQESAEHMEELNDELSGLEREFSYPEGRRGIRDGLEMFREELFTLPGLSALNLSAFYIWGLLLWVFYLGKRKQRNSFLMAWPLLVVLLICVAGPAYGWYFRYMYAIAFCLPGVILAGWADK